MGYTRIAPISFPDCPSNSFSPLIIEPLHFRGYNVTRWYRLKYPTFLHQLVVYNMCGEKSNLHSSSSISSISGSWLPGRGACPGIAEGLFSIPCGPAPGTEVHVVTGR